MTRRRLPLLAAAAAALATLPAGPASSQAVTYREPAPSRASAPAEALADRYRVRLRSAWPQLPAIEGCENGGHETLEGVLTRTGVRDYSGTFTRRTHLLFCGAHGADGAACALVLEGRGRVAMHGMVVSDERSASGRALRVVWSPAPEHGVEVRGACGEAFKQGIQRMYLTARHGAEFAVPNDGAAPQAERLEDYAWVVEIE